MKRAIAWFAHNSVAANLLMFMIVAGGLAAIPSINQKTFPDITIEVISIAVPYLGASPEEVENGVCVRIEEEIHGIDGIERISSSANEGACGVSAELVEGTSIDRALTEIKNAVDGISTFPEQTERPVVSHYTFRRNALQIAVSGEADEKALRIWAERIRDEIAALPGVTQVELVGARDYEISVEVPEESLRRHGLTFQQVADAVRASSIDLPGGALRTDGGEILLRTKGQAYAGEEFENIVVLTRDDGTRVLLGEVASVVDGFSEDERRATFDGDQAILIRVYRVGEQKVLDLVSTVLGYVETTRARLPDGLHLSVWQNQAIYLEDRLDILVKNGRGGFILVFVILALFLKLRLAFWVAIGVPISFLGALIMFPTLGLSIDVLTLFAFILVLGLLVDDAIVIGENVHTHQERSEEPLAASIAGAQEVSIPVIFGVLTTVAAFIPMIVSPGMMKDFFGAIGLVVIASLFFSLVESQLILPAHLGHHAGSGVDKPAKPGTLQARWKRLQKFLAGSLTKLARERYRPALAKAIEWRYASLATGVAVLMVTMGALGTGRLTFSFFPSIEGDYISATLTMPEGTSAQRTAAAVAILERSALAVREELDAEGVLAKNGGSIVKHVLANVGQYPNMQGGPPRRGVAGANNQGGVAIELVGGDNRPVSSETVAKRWRERTPPIPGVEELTFTSDYMSAGDPIAVEFRAQDNESLVAASDAMKAKLADYPGVFDITDSWRDGKEEIKLNILPAAETLGITQTSLGRQVRQAFYGEEAQRVQRGRDDIRVMVRYPREDRRSLEDLENLRIRTPDGGEVPFYAVARAERGRGYATIRRADRQRIITVTANLDAERANANQILRELEAGFIPELIGRYPGLQYSLEGEQREQRKTLGGLARNYGFAMIMIFALLAVPLRSYLQPFLIMGVIPFGLVGAIGGHLLLGLSFSMMSVFGVVALSGVVVNSNLVLVHYINNRRAAGMPLEQAVRDAGVARFRPIVLTSITTFAGLSPLLLEESMGAQFLIPMGASLGFGVVFATVISLFLLPCSYVALEDVIALVRRFFGRGDDVEPPRPGLRPVEAVKDVAAAGR